MWYHVEKTTSIQAMYNAKDNCTKEKCMNINSVALNTDYWTSRTIDSYITITGHFITDCWQLKSFNVCLYSINYT